MKNIKNITVATDFSVTARNAYRYAKGLAGWLNAALTVVHVKETAIMVSDVVTTPPKDDPQLIADIEEFIAEENFSTGSFPVKIKVLTGDPVDALTLLSDTNETDLIVIGTTGLADVLTKIIGSTSVKVSNKAHSPVILVPRNVKWHSVETILFASNFDSMTRDLTQNIIDFALNIHAGIHFVNVRNYDPMFEIKQKDIDWSQLFVDKASDLLYEKHTVYGNDTMGELNKYAADKKISLLAFTSKHRNFWENLVHKSVTENMVLSATLPILVMHLDDK